MTRSRTETHRLESPQLSTFETPHDASVPVSGLLLHLSRTILLGQERGGISSERGQRRDGHQQRITGGLAHNDGSVISH